MAYPGLTAFTRPFSTDTTEGSLLVHVTVLSVASEGETVASSWNVPPGFSVRSVLFRFIPAHEDFFHTFVASDGLAGKFEAFFVVATYGRSAQHYRTQTASAVFITFRRRYGRDDIDIEQFAERPVRLHVEELFGASLHVAEILAVLHFAVGISIAHEHEVDSVALGSPLIDSHFALLGIIAGHIEVRFWQIRIVIRSHYLPVRLPSVVGRIQLV